MTGSPPATGWAKLAPELLVSDFARSLRFWRECLGFIIAYDRPEQPFAYLERPEGGQVMICQRSGDWETADMDPPYGRGIMLQVQIAALEPVLNALGDAQWPIYSPLRVVWRKTGDRESGQREIFVQDPDGYLIMLAESLGERPIQR
jgi:catechol 2,3-dioxygenase-like lactoylglutathione lyase family enzyme